MREPQWLSCCAALLILVAVCGCVPRSEDDVVVYSALDQEFAKPILNAFERSGEDRPAVVAKYDVESTKTVGLVSQLIAEAEQPHCDVFWNNEIMHTVRLQKLGLLEPHRFQVERGWPADLIASDGTWCGFAARARVLIINREQLGDRSPPTSVLELADPRWRGECGMARPLFGTTATHWAVLRESLGRDQALKTLREIRDNAVVLSGNKQVAQAVSAGRLVWGVTDTDDAIIEQEQGYPVEIVFPDQAPDQPGTLRIPNTVAILKGAPHPVAAGRLVDFLVTPEIEDRLAMGPSSQIPISNASKFPPAVLPTEPIRWMRADFEAAANDWEAWAAELQEIFQAQ